MTDHDDYDDFDLEFMTELDGSPIVRDDLQLLPPRRVSLPSLGDDE